MTVQIKETATSIAMERPSKFPFIAALQASIAHAGNSQPPREAMEFGSKMRGIMLPERALRTNAMTGAIATKRAREPQSAARATKKAALATAATLLAHTKANTELGINLNTNAPHASVKAN